MHEALRNKYLPLDELVLIVVVVSTCRRDDHKIVKLLLKHALKKGIDVDTIDRYGRTPTHFAFGYEYDLEVYNNDHTLSHDHNSEYPDPHQNGKTPMQMSIKP